MSVQTGPSAPISYQDWKTVYHAELQRRAEAATLAKVRGGRMVGRLQLGYEYGPDGLPALDPAREAPLREAFLLAAEGRLSTRKILDEVTAGRLTARSGRPLSVSQLWRILTDPFYMGMVTYREGLFPGRHQPLVSGETFRKAQENLALRRRR